MTAGGWVRRREVFAACSTETLIAEADRITVLERHVAAAVDRDAFRARVAASLERTAQALGSPMPGARRTLGPGAGGEQP